MHTKMHADEIDVNMDLVSRLISSQCPQWAELPLERVPSAGTDNALFRLGENYLVRLPRIDGAVEDVQKEQRFLSMLAPHLPFEVPTPLFLGDPDESYPCRWSIYSWIEGTNPVVGQIPNPELLASDLAEFIVALHSVDVADGPPAGRGAPLATRDAPTLKAIAELAGLIDTKAATSAWKAALEIPEWTGSPVWLHADLSPGNLLLRDGRLKAVIDFGCSGIGDPACDAIPAWNLLPASARETFRAALGFDDATWERGRGWALSIALIQLPYYKETNPALAANARHVIGEVLGE